MPPPPPPAERESPPIENVDQGPLPPPPPLDEENPGNEDSPGGSPDPPLDINEEPDPPSDIDSDDPPLSDDEDDPSITLKHMKANFRLVRMVWEATLDTQFSRTELDSFRNPQESHISLSDDPDLRLSMKFFMLTLDHLTSQRAYTEACEDILERYPDSGILSYDQVKRRVSNLSGVYTWKHDMCIDSCAAFAGPFAHLDQCPLCGEYRYDQKHLRKSKKKVPQKVFTTFPLGPQLQARWRNPQMAEKMLYRLKQDPGSTG